MGLPFIGIVYPGFTANTELEAFAILDIENGAEAANTNKEPQEQSQ